MAVRSGAIEAALIAAALSAFIGAARAHAPLPRALAVAPDGSVAVRMPGFGWLLGRDGVFTYACDALLGVSPLEERTPMAYRSDGGLIVGTARGVQRLDASGCPVGAASLQGAEVIALAAHPRARQRVVAVAQAMDAPPHLHVSDDGGESWRLGAQLSAEPVTALVLDASDSDRMYVSGGAPSARPIVEVSSDGGATFEAWPQPRALTMLHADAARQRYWAMARVPQAPVGVVILRADAPSGPWAEALTVNFFGGLVVDPDDPDRIFVGDEARGIYRSVDGGATFVKSAPAIASAALELGDGALWSCTPAQPHDTALVRSGPSGADFEPVMAFVDVVRLVECPEVDVAATCRAAWLDWQRDVLQAVPTPSAADAGLPDTGATAAPDATAADAALEPWPEPELAAAQHKPASCAAPTSAGRSSDCGWLAPVLALGWLAARARRARSRAVIVSDR